MKKSAVDRIEGEIKRERAETLGRAGERLEDVDRQYPIPPPPGSGGGVREEGQG